MVTKSARLTKLKYNIGYVAFRGKACHLPSERIPRRQVWPEWREQGQVHERGEAGVGEHLTRGLLGRLENLALTLQEAGKRWRISGGVDTLWFRL